MRKSKHPLTQTGRFGIKLQMTRVGIWHFHGVREKIEMGHGPWGTEVETVDVFLSPIEFIWAKLSRQWIAAMIPR